MKLRRRGGLLAPLRHRDFLALIVGFTVSASGSWAYNVGLTVYVFDRTHSPAWAGAVTLGRFIPSAILGAYGGVLAERFERVRLMVVLDVVCAALMGGLTLLAALHGPPLAAIAIGGINSVVSMAYTPAVVAITPQLVPEDDLAAANTIRNTVENLAVIAGPGLGALLLLAGSATLAFAANAISFLFSAVAVSRISARSQPVDVTEGGTSGPLKQMLVGVQTIVSSSTATVLATYSVIASFVYGTDTVLFVVVSHQQLHSGSEGYGYLLAGLGVGGVLAAGLVTRISAWPRLGTAILVGMAVYCLPTLGLIVVHQTAVAFVLQVVRGAGTLVVDVLAITAMQRSLPADKQARVFGAFFTLVIIAISLGALVTPQVLKAAGLTTTLWLAGAALPGACVLGWPWLRKMDNANVAQLTALAPRIAILQRAAILAEAPQAVLERLASEATEIEVPAGRAVVTEGEEADALYIIETGTMGVRSRGGGEVERELPPLGDGDYFGEIGLLEHIPRTATVTASTPSRLLRIEGQDFLDALVTGTASPSLLEGAAARLARTPSYRTRPAGGTDPDDQRSMPIWSSK